MNRHSHWSDELGQPQRPALRNSAPLPYRRIFTAVP